MTRHVWSLLCIAVLCTTLTLGLWPFRAPRNGVTWQANHNGLRFDRDSTLISTGTFRAIHPRPNLEASLEIWLQPTRIWDYGTFLAFYRPTNLFQFQLRQRQTDLVLQTVADQDCHGNATLRVENVFYKSRPAFITITSGVKVAAIYVDGILREVKPHYPICAADFAGQLVLGDSPGQSDSWKGQLLGLAIYGRQLDATQVVRNYATWRNTGRPELTNDEDNLALYLFDERLGTVVHDKSRSGVDLYIPAKYQVMSKIFLEPFWNEFSMARSYWSAALKNIIGFIPFGICFYAYLSGVPSIKRALLLTVVLGTATSFTIELLQGFLPTRDSGMTDIITNTLGTCIGAFSYHLLAPPLALFVPWFPLPSRLSSPLLQPTSRLAGSNSRTPSGTRYGDHNRPF